MEYIWLIWSLLLIGIWFAIYFWLKDWDKKREMFIVSSWTSLLGLTEPLFVPAYWMPPSLFDLAHTTGFDIESFIFSFGIGGIVFVLYELFFKSQYVVIPISKRQHTYHLWALLSAPVLLTLLWLFTKLNPIYSAIIAMVAGGIATWYCRPDLKKKMIVSAFLFLALYFFYFLTLFAMDPGYVDHVWNLKALSGILIAGVPIEELLFALSFGFIWSSFYEHIRWRKVLTANDSLKN